MNLPLEKIDPSMFKTVPIEWSEDPVNSLSTINANFSELDVSLCNLEFSANNFWEPLYSTFSENSGKWNSVYETVRDNSATWQNTYNTVNTLSGGWSSPISMVYPNIQNGVSTTTILNWISTNFPARENNVVNYLDGQKFFIFIVEWAIAGRAAANNCRLYDTNYFAPLRHIQCTITKFGGAGQSGGWGSGWRGWCRKATTCSGGVSVYTQDRYVNRIKGYSFVVNNGNWRFSGNLY